jgi:hypothetical protein
MLDAVDLMMQKQSRSAEYQAEDCHSTEWDCNIDDAGVSDRFKHEETEDAIDKIKKANDVFVRCEVSPARVEQRCL